MDRRDTILANLKLDGLGLEIGPGHSPIAAGEPGLRVKILDHTDQESLIAKFGKVGQDTSRIQPVDYVWSGQRYRDLVGDTRFDWIVASHVIEHVPDLVGFIAECGDILAEGGVLSLAIPDKRGTFDLYRPPTGLGAVIDAHQQRRATPSPGLLAEFQLNFADLSAGLSPPPMPLGPDKVRKQMDRLARGDYIDIHAWTFTPSSFRLMVEDLHALDMLPMREAWFGDSIGFEFYMQLTRDGPGPGLDRQALGLRALEELGQAGASARAEAAEALGERLARTNAELEAEIEALRRTVSWRVTAPLRALRRLGA